MADNISVKQLKELLAEHDDKESLHFGITFSSKHSYQDKLEEMLSEAYSLLLNAEDRVDYVAKQEQQSKQNLVFFDASKAGGGNTGARGLKREVKDFLQTYTERLLRAQIES